MMPPVLRPYIPSADTWIVSVRFDAYVGTAVVQEVVKLEVVDQKAASLVTGAKRLSSILKQEH